jgi:hypothetical protein
MMRAVSRALVLSGLILAFLITQAPAAPPPYALIWSGPLRDGTPVTVVDFYETPWPGRPGPPILDGQQPGTAKPAPVDTLWAVFGDAGRLADCTRSEIQGPVLQDGDDGVFTARLGAFASDDSVTVFFVWNRDFGAQGCAPTTGVDLGAGRSGPPGQPKFEF